MKITIDPTQFYQVFQRFGQCGQLNFLHIEQKTDCFTGIDQPIFIIYFNALVNVVNGMANDCPGLPQVVVVNSPLGGIDHPAPPPLQPLPLTSTLPPPCRVVYVASQQFRYRFTGSSGPSNYGGRRVWGAVVCRGFGLLVCPHGDLGYRGGSLWSVGVRFFKIRVNFGYTRYFATFKRIF